MYPFSQIVRYEASLHSLTSRALTVRYSYLHLIQIICMYTDQCYQNHINSWPTQNSKWSQVSTFLAHLAEGVMKTKNHHFFQGIGQIWVKLAHRSRSVTGLWSLMDCKPDELLQKSSSGLISLSVKKSILDMFTMTFQFINWIKNTYFSIS